MRYNKGMPKPEAGARGQWRWTVDHATIVVAVVAAAVSAFALRQAQQAQVDQEEQLRREQATEVLFFGYSDVRPNDGARPANKNGEVEDRYRLYATNYSRLPVPYVWMISADEAATTSPILFSLGSIGACQQILLDPFAAFRSGPGSTLSLVFRDAAGLVWKRSANGELERSEEPVVSEYALPLSSSFPEEVERTDIPSCAGG